MSNGAPARSTKREIVKAVIIVVFLFLVWLWDSYNPENKVPEDLKKNVVHLIELFVVGAVAYLLMLLWR
jgi:hypothetical protein